MSATTQNRTTASWYALGPFFRALLPPRAFSPRFPSFGGVWNATPPFARLPPHDIAPNSTPIVPHTTPFSCVCAAPRLAAPVCCVREEEAQVEALGSGAQQLLHGCPLPWLPGDVSAPAILAFTRRFAAGAVIGLQCGCAFGSP